MTATPPLAAIVNGFLVVGDQCMVRAHAVIAVEAQLHIYCNATRHEVVIKHGGKGPASPITLRFEDAAKALDTFRAIQTALQMPKRGVANVPATAEAQAARVEQLERLVIYHADRYTELAQFHEQDKATLAQQAAACARAEADLRTWRAHHVQPRCHTRCPSCGHDTLFIAAGGHLTCSWIECTEPGVGRAIEALKSGRAQAEAEAARQREALRTARNILAETPNLDAASLAIIDAALSPDAADGPSPGSAS